MKYGDFRKVSEEARNAIRKRAIKLIESGMKKSEVAALFGVKNGTITDWVKNYKPEFDYKFHSDRLDHEVEPKVNT
jgi:transposase